MHCLRLHLACQPQYLLGSQDVRPFQDRVGIDEVYQRAAVVDHLDRCRQFCELRRGETQQWLRQVAYNGVDPRAEGVIPDAVEAHRSLDPLHASFRTGCPNQAIDIYRCLAEEFLQYERAEIAGGASEEDV